MRQKQGNNSQRVAYTKESLDETPFKFEFNDAPMNLAVSPEPEEDAKLDEPQLVAGAVPSEAELDTPANSTGRKVLRKLLACEREGSSTPAVN